MASFLLRTPSDARRLPWRNGRGVTEELAIGPAGATFERDDWDWRLSRAAVVEDGPFSVLPGVDRVLVLTEGAGLVLRHGADGTPTRLVPLVAHAFAGDAPTQAALVAGPVRDLNVMTRRGRAMASVEVVRAAAGAVPRVVPAGDLLVHAVAGTVGVAVAGVATRWALAPGCTLVATGRVEATSLALDGAPEAVAVVVSLVASSA